MGKFLFKELPPDLIKYILCFDKFILENGELVIFYPKINTKDKKYEKLTFLCKYYKNWIDIINFYEKYCNDNNIVNIEKKLHYIMSEEVPHIHSLYNPRLYPNLYPNVDLILNNN